MKTTEKEKEQLQRISNALQRISEAAQEDPERVLKILEEIKHDN